MTDKLTLRKTTEADLGALFEIYADEAAAYMAAFMPENWRDRDAFFARRKENLLDPEIFMNTILLNGEIAGTVGTYKLFGELQITYGVKRDYWNKGVATRALQQLLAIMKDRPVYGRVAFDNTGSMRVLEKCGFVQAATDKFFAHARGAEIDEIIFKLP
jgi:RimJ/RimL family protein N-acetyltransferase